MRAFRIDIAAIGPLLALLAAGASAHDGAPNCDPATAAQPAFERARAELRQSPRALDVRIELSDRLIDAGCYDDAVHVLEDGLKAMPNDRTLDARLRTARSFVSEREYLRSHPVTKSDMGEAELRRLQLRCRQLGDVQACDQALAARADDVALLLAKGDALLKAQRARDALMTFIRIRQANARLAPDARMDVTDRISAAQALVAAQSPPSIAPTRTRIAQSNPATAVNSTARVASAAPTRTYSNLQPPGQSN